MEKFLELLKKAVDFISYIYERAYFWFYLFGTIIVIGVVLFLKPWQQQEFIQNLKSSVENLRGRSTTQTLIPSPVTTMKLVSSAFEANAAIPPLYTCDGSDISPPLRIQAVPANAKSLALIVHDPDAPHPGGWTHWVVWNISPQTTEIAENTVPVGAVQGHTDSGTNQWGGPCPPSGTHHYRFILYALDTTLDLPPTTTKSDLEKSMEGHTIEQYALVGTYERR